MAHQQHESCIRACLECAQECEHCATACLEEQDVSAMAECIRLDRDCSAICFMAAAYMSRDSRFATEICRICADICDACGQECRRHETEHCQRCAEACERCAEECRQMAGAMA
jgi:hypothetical protein